MRFQNKCVVVTGAASGIGRATALLFAHEGAAVFAADIDAQGAEALATEVETITAVGCDVCDPDQIKALMEQAAAVFGGIDYLFNNAGAGGALEAVDEIDVDGWDHTMALLLRSVAMGIRHAVPHMKHRPGAAIINTSSVAAIGPGYSPTTYAVAKAGVLQLTRCAATDLARYGIRVNAVQPGFINTNIFASVLDMPKEQFEASKAAIAQMSSHVQPVARAGLPGDVAEAVAFLCSEQGSFMNGTSMIVDGGLTIGPRHTWDQNTPGLMDAIQAAP
jgi:NAD(P)-dependent dehydrogenase (short-subunit alcohol dehydrogenase family)